MADTIKEFLVGLGFKIDESGLKAFNGSIASATKFVASLGTAVVATATAVVASVEKMSAEMEDLYYAGERTKSTVLSIQSLEFAARQVGGVAGEAAGALEGLASAMRSNPGKVGLIESLGVSTFGKSGKEILDGLIDKFRQMPFFIAKQYAAMLGISEDALLVLERDTGAYSGTIARLYKEAGVDADDSAKKSHEFMVEVRTLGATLNILAVAITNHLRPAATWIVHVWQILAEMMLRLDRRTHGVASTILVTLVPALGALLIAWRVLNSGFIASPIGAIITLILALGAALVLLYDDYEGWKDGSESLIDWAKWKGELDNVLAIFTDLWSDLKGWLAQFKPYVDQIREALGPFWTAIKDDALALFEWLKGIAANVWEALKKADVTEFFKGAFQGIIDLIHLLTDLLRGDWAAAWGDAKKVVLDVLNDIGNAVTLLGRLIWNLLPTSVQQFFSKVKHDAAAETDRDRAAYAAKGGVNSSYHLLTNDPPAPTASPSAPVSDSAGLPLGLRQNNPGNLRKWGDAAIQHGFAVFKSLQEGVSAASGNLLRYAKRGWDSIGEIVGHWAPAGDKNNVPAYIADLVKKTGFGAGDHLNLYDPAVQQRLLGAIFGREQGRLVDPSTIAEGIRSRLGKEGGALTPDPAARGNGHSELRVSQETNITVNGGGDAGAAARGVLSGQSRTNGDLVRNLKTAVVG